MITDRPTKAHEYLFLFAKSPRYYFDALAIAEPAIHAGSVRKAPAADSKLNQEAAARLTLPVRKDTLIKETRNKRDVWSVSSVPFPGAHFATYPPELIRPCILAGSARGDTVLDPFSGSGTTGMVATQEGRRYVGIDVNAEYLDLSLRTRFAAPVLDLTGGTE